MSAAIYFHGGQKGLSIGDFILPPSITGYEHSSVEMARRMNMESPARLDRVYVTTSMADAMVYAVMHPSKGDLYAVIPWSELEPDPDCLVPGLSYQCERAKIIRKYRPTRKQRQQILGVMFADDATQEVTLTK